MLQVSGFGTRVAGSGVRGPGFGFGSQDVCKGARFPVEGERCVLSSRSLFKWLEVNEEEEKFGGPGFGIRVSGSGFRDPGFGFPKLIVVVGF